MRSLPSRCLLTPIARLLIAEGQVFRLVGINEDLSLAPVGVGYGGNVPVSN
jgi:hypothetical protein